jgi:hypothetical protein
MPAPRPREGGRGPGRADPGFRTPRYVAAGAAVLALLASGRADAQTTTLRGEVLQRDGQPAAGIRLVVVGHPPEVVLRDGALFTHALSGAPSEVSVRVVGLSGMDVLYPPGGRIVVPRDPGAVVPIVIGERIGEAVGDRIGRDIAAIRETLEVRGVSETEIEAVIRAELDGLVARLAALTQGAVESAVSGAAQTELRERVNRYLGTYLRRSRDLVDAFDLVDTSRPITLSESLVLRDAIGNYSDAFGEFDRELSEVPASLARAWPGEDGATLRDRMASLLTGIRTGLHAEMLALRGPLVVIQREFTSDRPSRQELAAARAAIGAALPRVRPVLAALETEVPLMMAALRDPRSP